jgi:hypothetical protein
MKKLFLSLLLLSTASCNALGGGSKANGGGDGDGDVDDPNDPDVTGVLPDGSDVSAVLPARIRRLTNAEYDASVRALIGTELTPGADFPPDTRQHGFTLNEAQRVDPVLARKLDAAAAALGNELVGRIDEFAPCDGDPAGCAASFIQSFGAKAYRRPLTDEDAAGLMGLYELGASEGDYASGIHQVVRGILQSPGFLYLTEIGDGSESGTVVMTPYEIAASMSYLLTGGPPDEALVAAAENGDLSSAEGRTAEAQRLVTSADGGTRAIRIVRQWLGVDRIVATAKDANIYPEYEALRADMHQETEAFVWEVLATSGGNVEDL